ncbi:MAG: Ig-like domain-containing protein [Verrucomicrobiota bacterium]
MKTVFQWLFRSCLLLAIVSGSGAGSLCRAQGAVTLDPEASKAVNLQFPGVGVPPFLIFTDPMNGATGVSMNTPIKFTFTAAMATDNRVSWSANVNAADIAYSQNADKTELTCTPDSGWPVGLITWDLTTFKGDDGTPIFAVSLQGRFTTSGGSSTNNPCNTPGGSSTAGFTVFKQVSYTQDSSSAPVLDGADAASFSASLISPVVNPVTQVTLKDPAGSTSTLTRVDPFPPITTNTSFFQFDSFITQIELDAAFPTGGYTLTADRQDGSIGSATVNLANNSYPPVPQINNFPAAQSVDSALDFVLQWNGFAGAAAEDFISIEIHDQTGVVFQAPDPCVPRLLPNTATSVVIPGKTLQAGTTYDASLSYFRLSGTNNSIAGIPGTVGFSKTTSFKLKTTGGNPQPTAPRFTSFIRLSNGSFEVQLTGQPGVSYVIEGSTDLANPPLWIPLKTASSPTGVIDFVDVQAATLLQRFLRARTAP